MTLTYIDKDGAIISVANVTKITPVVNGAKLFVQKEDDITFPKVIPIISFIEISEDII